MTPLEQTQKEITLAVKILDLLIKNTEYYGSYRLRRARRSLLERNNMTAHMSYPKADPEIVPTEGKSGFKYVTPVSICIHSRMATGGRGGLRMVTR